MCGFAGYLSIAADNNGAETILRKMATAISHRGPDDTGVWIGQNGAVGFAHRRLSIIDLSSNGSQPMVSDSGRYVMAFNGEIYNYRKLQRCLEMESCKTKWQGHSDTEILLACLEHWGIEKTLQACVGMFAFSLWDCQDRTLILARDRFGEKPLYYGWQNNHFLFGSELKSLKEHPKFQGKIDRNALCLFLRHNYIPGPYSIYENIQKLTPGTYLKIDTRSSLGKALSPPIPYWSLNSKVETVEPIRLSDGEAITELESLLGEAVSGQMLADVPLGAFLSGGIDSSTIVSLMQANSHRPVKTFSIGFYEDQYNEAQYAKSIARHLGTDHTELYVSPKDSMDVIPNLPLIYDEPFSDSSQIPTYLVSQMTRRHVTVSLSGDGGDELFGGYNRYFWGNSINRKIGWLPVHLRKALGRCIGCFSPIQWDALSKMLYPVIPPKYRMNMPGDRLHKFASVLSFDSMEGMYNTLVSHWQSPAEVVHGGEEPLTLLRDKRQWPVVDSEIEWMMYLDALTYLPDDILVKVDRAAMAVSLETRVPFLDHRVAEFAWRLPLSMKIRDGKGKWLLRQVLYKYVPQKLIERPKMGFGVPIDSWLRGPLKDWAENLLDESKIHNQGYFDPRDIRKKWNEHLSGTRNWQYLLWDILMFQAWLEKE